MILWTLETTNDFMRRIDGIEDNEKKKNVSHILPYNNDQMDFNANIIYRA